VNEAIELTRSVPGANLLLNAAVARANRYVLSDFHKRTSP
jgi:hypothetical protein